MEEEIKKPLGRWGEYKKGDVLSVTKNYIKLFTSVGNLPNRVKIKLDKDNKQLILELSEDLNDWKVVDTGRINVTLLNVENGVYKLVNKGNDGFTAEVKLKN